jgi:cell division septal protein FtsQ
LSIVATLALVAAAAFGILKLFETAAKRVREDERFNVATRDIEATPLPAWIRSDLLAQVQRLGALPDSINTLEPDLAGELRDAFSLHPWVREVVEVRITHPRTIRVKLEYREPIAVVQSVRSLEAVDRDGVTLPASELPDTSLYLTVIGVRSTPTGPAGTKWEDPSLAAAVAVVSAIAPHHRTLGLTTIDVSGYRANGTAQSAIYLLTDRGTRVKWGRPPNVDYPGEVPVQDKIDRLSKYATENGSLDCPAGPYDVDVTHWQEFTVRPRGQAPSKTR